MESVEVRTSSPVSADVRTAGGNTADPTGASSEYEAEENSPTENQSRRKKKGIRAFFRRIGKAMCHIFSCDEDDIVSPFPCSDPTDVQPDSSGLQCLSSVDPCPSGIDLPVNSDPEPSPVPGPSALDSEIPGPSGLGPAFEKQKKRKKKKGIRAFLRRRWRAVKRSVRGFQKGNKVAPDSFADQTDPEPLSVSSPSTMDSGMATAVADLQRRISFLSSLLADLGPSHHERTSDPYPEDPRPSPVPGPSGFWPVTGSLSSFYEVKSELGRGAFGTVFEGTRRFDGQKVAIKFLPKNSWNKFIELPGSTKPLLAEVAMNLLMRKPPKSPHIVEMLDWFDQPEQYVLIMEYPHPCETLFKFAMRNGGLLDETVARGLMRQAVFGAEHFIDQGVYHNDIHSENILVNTETLQLKFIDFGRSELFKTSEDREWLVQLTVWSLGKVLLEMVSGSQPSSVQVFFRKLNPFHSSLSNECQDLIKQCLDAHIKSLSLEQMLEHAWFEQD